MIQGHEASPRPPLRVVVVVAVLAACALVQKPPKLHYSLAESPRIRLERAAPDVVWKWETTLTVNMDGDDAPELAVLGTTATEAVLGVVIGAEAEPWVSRWVQGSGSMDLCAPPSAMYMGKYLCGKTGAPPYCAPTRDRPVVNPALEAVQLDSGTCDGFHFYFDGVEFIWWRL
jgi:hypothetical protein